MKSFSQFLQESYLNEAEVQGNLFTRSDKPQDFRNPKKIPFTATDPIAHEKGSILKKSKLYGYDDPKPTPPSSSKGQLSIPGTNVGRPGDAARNEAEIEQRKATERASNPKPPKPDGGSSGGGGKPPSGGKPPMITKPTKIPGLKSGGAISAALGTADEKMKGSGWARSLAKGATVATGTVLGGLAGGAAGTAVAPGAGTAIGGFAGQAAGAAAAEKAFDTVAGANAKERKSMATANRQRQSGTAIKGIGGPTSFDTKKNTMTTGTGAQRKTVQLAKTGVVQRGGQSVAGHLAYKGGKAVYKAGPSAQSLAKTSSNPLERIGRSLFAGAYKKSDAANAAKNLAKARQSDAARNKALGVKSKPAG